jgi:predicted esterase
MQSLTTHYLDASATVKTGPFGTRVTRVFSTKQAGPPVLRRAVLTLGALLIIVPGLMASPLHIEWSTGSQAAFRGGTISFTARCTSDVGELTNQWYRNGEPLEGQTTGRLVLGNLQAGDEGDYTLRATNLEGSIETEPARLYVVRPIDDLAEGEITDDTGRSLPYLFSLPEGYDPARAYPMSVFLWGSGQLGYKRLKDDLRVYPWATVLRSCGIEATHPTVLVFPARLGLATSWDQRDYPLLLGMVDRLAEQYSIDTNRVQLVGWSDGGGTAWALTGERPGFFASIMTWATTGAPPDPRATDPVPAWLFCAADDFLLGNNRTAVNRLLQAGYHPMYTEYRSGGHTSEVLKQVMCNPAFVDWWLDQKRGVPSSRQPVVSIAQANPDEICVTSRMTLNLDGSASALDQEVREVKWSNLTAGVEGVAQGTILWSAADIPLVPDQTNLIVMTATTTSWSGAMPGEYFGTTPGETRFYDTLTIVCRPIRIILERQGPEATLSWSNGEGPFTVQRATTLDPGAWTDFLSNAVAPVVLPLESPQGFYRIVGQ